MRNGQVGRLPATAETVEFSNHGPSRLSATPAWRSTGISDRELAGPSFYWRAVSSLPPSSSFSCLSYALEYG